MGSVAALLGSPPADGGAALARDLESQRLSSAIMASTPHEKTVQGMIANLPEKTAIKSGGMSR